MDEREFEEAVKAHNTPPPVPRERMWQRIDAAREPKRGVLQPDFGERRDRSRLARYGRLATAAAAVLVLGVALGRWTSPTTTGPVAVAPTDSMAVPAGPTGESANAAATYQFAAAQLFGRADYLLTDFAVRACNGDGKAEVPRWATGLLVQTRLLMDSPAADEAGLRRLLEELELVLVQITGLSAEDCSRDVEWIKDGLKERDTIDRLRLMAAAGSPARPL